MTFTGYYSSEAREGFIAAALQGIQGWTVLVRNNPGQQYPSDFSLVKVYLLYFHDNVTMVMCVFSCRPVTMEQLP